MPLLVGIWQYGGENAAPGGWRLRKNKELKIIQIFSRKINNIFTGLS